MLFSSFISLINIDGLQESNDLLKEFLRSAPAWIALIIAFVSPYITKRLEIEKSHKLFIFEEKYKIYSEHFTKLHSYNNAIKDLIVILKLAIETDDGDITNIENAFNEFNKTWHDIKTSEAKLWMIAPSNILNLRSLLLQRVKSLNKKLNEFKQDGELIINNERLNEIIQVSQELQEPLAQYLDYYRDEIQKRFQE